MLFFVCYGEAALLSKMNIILLGFSAHFYRTYVALVCWVYSSSNKKNTVFIQYSHRQCVLNFQLHKCILYVLIYLVCPPSSKIAYSYSWDLCFIQKGLCVYKPRSPH